MSLPKVSIIIPVYNTVDYIESCVTSALEQTYPNIELICVDNNSTDGSLEKLRELEKKHPLLNVFVEKTQGAPSARNTGLSHASGEWIQFLDSDDMLLPEKIAHQIALIGNLDFLPDILVGGYFTDNSEGRHRYKVESFDSALDALVTSRIGCTCSNLWRKELLDIVGGWRVEQRSSQERDLFLRLVKNGAIAVADDEPLTIVRQRNDGSISAIDKKGNIERVIGVLRETYDYLLSIEDEEDKIQYTKDTIFGKLRELTNYDIEKASRIYSEVFPEPYIPQYSSSTTPTLLWLIKLLGFRKAHLIRNIFK